jgi:hypothetical protein
MVFAFLGFGLPELLVLLALAVVVMTVVVAVLRQEIPPF